MRHAWPLLFSCAFLCPRAGTASDSLSATVLSLDELLSTPISTAAKYEQTLGEAPASVTIVTAEEIERYGYRTLEELMQGVRGFYLSNDRNYSYLGVRGFSRPSDYNNRILLLLNGHTLNENIYGSAGLGTELGLPLEAVERLEIVRGPGAALYGTGAMFAVVNLITRKGQAIDGLRLSGQAGSFGRKQGSALFGRSWAREPEVTLSALWGDIDGGDHYYAEYDDPATNNGLAQDLDWDRHYSLLGSATWGDFSLQGFAVSRKKGIPTGAFGMAFNDGRARTLDASHHLEFRYDRDVQIDKNLFVRLYVDRYAYRGAYPYDSEEYKALFRETANGVWLGSELRFRWDLSPGHRLIAGGEYREHPRAGYRAWDEFKEYFDEDFPFRVFSLYVQQEYQARENLSLVAGVRRDHYSTAGSSTAPRLALIYNPWRAGAIKLLYGEAFRAPNIYETHYQDPGVSKPNPGLKPEEIRTLELVWEQRLHPGLLAIASLYNFRVERLIDQQLDSGDGLLQFQNAAGRVQASGLELELNARLNGKLSGYLNYALQRIEDKATGEHLSNSPPHLFKFGLSFSPLKYLDLSASGRRESGRRTLQMTDSGAPLKTRAYFLAGLCLATATPHSEESPLDRLLSRARLSLAIHNLFDKTHQTPGGVEHLQPAIAQDGRHYTLRLQYTVR